MFVSRKTAWISAVGLAFAIGLAGGHYGPVLWMKTSTSIQPTAVQIYAVDDVGKGDVDHFEGVTRTLRRPNASEQMGTWVSLELIVTPDGKVASATPTFGPKQFYADAVALALTWKLVPFRRNGQPVWARVSNAGVGIYAPERRNDYPVPFPALHNSSSVKITLERTACFGECPIYRTEVRGDGTVEYDGEGFVVVAGKHRAKVPIAVVKHLVDEFRKADFFSLLPRYVSQVTDNPTYRIGISFDGYASEVQDYVGEPAGMPSIIRRLEDEVDRALDTKRWTRGNRQTVPSLIAEDWDFKANTCANTSLVAGAARYASVDVVRALLAQGAPVHIQCGERGYGTSRTPALQSAVEHNDEVMVDALLETKAQRYDDDFERALVEAARQGNEELIDRLKFSNLRGPRNFHIENGETLLMAAAESCMPHVVENALFKADVNAADEKGKTALFYAIGSSGAYGKGHDCAATVKTLLDAGAKIDLSSDGETPLMANLSDPKIAKILIAAGADVNARNELGWTALMSSFDAGLTRALLEAGADPWIVDNDGKNALQHAKEAGGSQAESARVLEAWMKDHFRPKK